MLLYIDPGTGSMLFTIILGAVSAVQPQAEAMEMAVTDIVTIEFVI